MASRSAACLGLLDYNPRIKKIDGRLFPFGFIHLLRNKREIKKMRVLSINVVPEYQRWGLGVVLLGGLIKPMQEVGHAARPSSPGCWNPTRSRAAAWKKGARNSTRPIACTITPCASGMRSYQSRLPSLADRSQANTSRIGLPRPSRVT